MRPDEVKTIWTPKATHPEQQDGAGIFSHLKPKGKATEVKDLNLPTTTITWDKFLTTILPTAEKIEIFLSTNEALTTLVTAVNADAPPIIQWDLEDERNPASWYLWNGGSHPSQYGLQVNRYSVVSAITSKPCEWGTKEFSHQGRGIIFLLEGAQETRSPQLCLFPEILKSEFHGIRSVIEAYSKSATLEGFETGSHAVGPMYAEKEKWGAKLKVTSAGQSQSYTIDRWD
jgi:hypothetical protein